jgi:hypothetical protein
MHRPVDPRRLEILRRWSKLLDSAFGIPGTRIRLGLDAILGLVPGLGDLVTPLFSSILLLHAAQVGVPKVIQFRMLVNTVVDALIGFVPVIGDVFDVAWKANLRNVELIERHARGHTRPTPGDWIFLWAIVAALIAAALVPIALGILLWNALS